MPKVFAMLPFGSIFGAIFFLLIFLAGLTSAISIGETGVSALIDEFKMQRKKATKIIYGIVLAAGILPVLSYTKIKLSLFGKPILDLMDYFFGTFLLEVAALVFTISVSWFWGSKKIIEAINKHTKLNMPHWIIYLIRYFIPLVLILGFIAGTIL